MEKVKNGDDTRSVCKYGANCYQKSASHLEKYKHPPKKRAPTQNKKIFEYYTKRPKRDEDAAVSSTTKISKDVSNSGDDDDDDDNDNDNDDKNTISDLQTKVDNITTNESKAISSTSKETSSESDNNILKLESIDDKKQFIKESFLLEMPDDFYTFWDFCRSLNKNNPSNAFSIVDLTLVGPYDVLANKFSATKPSDEYLVHWRYFHDPPEFQTVLKGNNSTGYHIGYFRDSPTELPVFTASNCALKDGIFSVTGDNIFAAVYLYLEEALKSSNPFQKMAILKLQAAVKAKATKLNLSLSERSSSIKERYKKVVTKTFNKVGLVVPYNRKTQLGYRHLCVEDKDLKKLLDRVINASPQQRDKVMSELQPVFTATDIAIDECDFGTGIELGWDILAHEVDSLNSVIEHFLCTSYNLLERTTFAKIAEVHMKNRKKGTDLSIL